DRSADVDRVAVAVAIEAEQSRERGRLRVHVVDPQLQLRHAPLRPGGEQLLDPLARRVDLEPVARVGRDERAPAAVLGHAQAIVHRTAEHRLVLLVVERDADVVDAGDAPVAGLHDDVHGAALELGQPELEAAALELLPRHAGLDRHVLVVDAAVARDEVEAELPDVAGLDIDDRRGDEVVVKEAHGASLSIVGVVPVAARSVEPRTAPGAADGAGGVPLPAACANACTRGPAGFGMAAGQLLDGDRTRRARAQLADRRARRGALLLHAHDAARDPRRSRAAVLRLRHDRPDPAPGARVARSGTAARPGASPRRAAGVGLQPLRLAHPVAVRRGAAPRLDPRV